ncbi:MAG: ABC transporter permease [Desulfuromonadaceae bacterium]|nr:ABC transporter permease [Desulfuromonadaceae bacterium]MDD2854618.1 ABC transporter permease [Desulfuromonadaceae bacterium]
MAKRGNPAISRAHALPSYSRKNSSRVQTIGIRLLFFTFLFILWQTLFALKIWNEMLFPGPLEVITTAVAVLQDGSMATAVLASLKRLITGYGISVAVGIPLGLIMGRNRLIDETFGTLALGLQALPSICWLPLAILWFGLNEIAICFVVIMGSVMAISLAVRDGVRGLSPLLLRAARVLGADGASFYIHVLFPAALPSVVTGARLGWSFAWRSLMAAELLYGTVGLGSTLSMGRELHDMGLVVATMLIIIAIGLIADRLLFGGMDTLIRARWGTER